jgi:hypothetical protein
MRFLMKVNIPVEAGNAAAKAGKLGSTIAAILADIKPEAVYFTDENGQRTGYVIFDMQDASQIPAIAEPWFLAFNASIAIHPVMIPDDLARAGSAIEKAVQAYSWILQGKEPRSAIHNNGDRHIALMRHPFGSDDQSDGPTIGPAGMVILRLVGAVPQSQGFAIATIETGIPDSQPLPGCRFDPLSPRLPGLVDGTLQRP